MTRDAVPTRTGCVIEGDRMRLLRSTPLLFTVAAAAVTTAPAAALPAQAAGVFVLGDRDGRDRGDRGRDGRDRDERLLFSWSGRVDREAVLTLRGRALEVRGDRDLVGRGERADAAVPRDPGAVFVRVAEGRGDVDILQRPTSRNGWTLVVRVRDPRAGEDRYRLSAFWVGEERDRDDDRGRGGGWRRDDTRSVARWTGLVDDDVELRIQGRSIRVFDRSGAPTRDVRSTVRRSLGRNDVVQVLDAAGRGSVRVVQQPAPWNGHTAIVRVRDRQGGAGRYDLQLAW
jgi:hypothetical protein